MLSAGEGVGSVSPVNESHGMEETKKSRSGFVSVSVGARAAAACAARVFSI